MKEGCLIWDPCAKRPDIMYDDGGCYGGLHCGDTLDALIRDQWQPTRIEYRRDTDTWYLVGIENGGGIPRLTVKK